MLQFLLKILTAENGRKGRQDRGRSERKDGQIHKIGNARRVEAVVDVVGVGSDSPESGHVGRIVGHFGFERFKVEQVMKVNVGLAERHGFQSVHDHG